MPSPNNNNSVESGLHTLTPEPAGDAPPAFLAAVGARRRQVRTQRAALAVVAIAVAVTAWQLVPRPAPQAQARPDQPQIAQEQSTPQPGQPPHATALASLRHLYTEDADQPLTLGELPSPGFTPAAEPALTPADSRKLLAGGA